VDHRRYSFIAHGQMQFWNPLPAGSLLKLIRELPLPNGAQVLDYGCGEGELALQLALWHRATITGVDPNPEAIARCRSKLPGTFLAEPFQPERFQPASFDLIANLGASPGMPQLLREVAPLLRPAAHLLIGDIYWRRPPSDTYLAFLGATGAPNKPCSPATPTGTATNTTTMPTWSPSSTPIVTTPPGPNSKRAAAPGAPCTSSTAAAVWALRFITRELQDERGVGWSR
jgi:SAM-dependent methyltransferase